MVAAGDRLFMQLRLGDTGREPWVSDGTRKGTRLLANLAPDLAGTYAGGGVRTPS